MLIIRALWFVLVMAVVLKTCHFLIVTVDEEKRNRMKIRELDRILNRKEDRE